MLIKEQNKTIFRLPPFFSLLDDFSISIDWPNYEILNIRYRLTEIGNHFGLERTERLEVIGKLDNGAKLCSMATEKDER